MINVFGRKFTITSEDDWASGVNRLINVDDNFLFMAPVIYDIKDKIIIVLGNGNSDSDNDIVT